LTTTPDSARPFESGHVLAPNVVWHLLAGIPGFEDDLSNAVY
jgi:hypothetical protein